MIKLIFNTIFLYAILFSHVAMASQPITDYLLKPTGQYGVAFKDLHWINKNICPDPNFSKKNKEYFSSNNKKYCHELMVRIYYPTTFKTNANTPYYRPIVDAEQNTLKKISTIKLEDIKQLAQLKSNTTENSPIVKNIQFPVILFISGLGGQTQLYENVITQLVSNGYIVVGINAAFVSGDILLPNNKVVSMAEVKNWDVVAKKTFPILEQDISFVYEKIHEAAQDPVFKSMDLKHIGALGHSFGGRAIANVADQHEKWFQALMTFDMEVHMGSYKPKYTTLPSMHIISSYWRSAFNWLPLVYRLNKNGYLVTLSPTVKNKHYSYHMNFTDFSTLQYLPAYQAFITDNHSRLRAGEDIITKVHDKILDDSNNLKRSLYLVIKNQDSWEVFYYEPGKNAEKIDIEIIAGLQAALNKLPSTQLKEPELIPVKNIIHAYHQGFGNYLGNGNGFKIAKAINLYAVDFFNTFLKNEKNIFKGCVPLTSNTHIECGPGVF